LIPRPLAARSFIKRFCKLLSLELSRKARERFRTNYRKPDVKWEDIYDSTAVKAKIRLMFPRDYNPMKGQDITETCKYRTAILFGPPGTGKTTYGRALAKKLGLDYLELTPGDFFAGGEASILLTINDIFEHLLHLTNTVVFIDEIDDLVKNRTPDQRYDRRTLFVNSLLPRFQELHDSGNIILLMATNNIEGVDDAIKRMGRVDLVIPVGAISPHGRLKYWYQFQEKHKEVFDMTPEEKMALDIPYLDATEAFNFSTLKHYSELVVDEISAVRLRFSEQGITD
jgi:SpoVK/Ycf46/Vps4 family AAA+-type ATPase